MRNAKEGVCLLRISRFCFPSEKHPVLGCDGCSKGNGGHAVGNACSMTFHSLNPAQRSPQPFLYSSSMRGSLAAGGEHPAADLAFPWKPCCGVVSHTHQHYPRHDPLIREVRYRPPGNVWKPGSDSQADSSGCLGQRIWPTIHRVVNLEIAETFSGFIIWLHYFHIGQLPTWPPSIKFGRKDWKAMQSCAQVR